ncbi:helix-turn-helix domain-containing protein [Streptosporangium sp. NBC_01810]|uniref:helix-turn-helix domain-containing protein n=1 Tax=Streptosporangium sp. NBC_01810 TaxID=2975951 RepID=UPI002DDA9ED0|nr:helix-turn-helix transcriptional regulator [Streptosporangium sp. NBC_01810]WSA25006.1 helix-turn-helix domain-containing protein [Streptosporangium sp. NBC_01810]
MKMRPTYTDSEDLGLVRQAHSPTVRRRRLAAELRRIREEKGLTIDQVAEQLDWHATKLSRFETGRRAVQPSDVRALLAVYEVQDRERDALLTLAREARQRGWWHVYGQAVPEWFEVYVGLESEASALHLYESEFVPGLLQTGDYIRAVHRAAQIRASEEEVDQRVMVRVARQKLLENDDPPHLWVIINEAAIRRPVGGVQVMRTQLEYLVQAATLPHVTLQVLPFSAGAHPAMGGGFHVLQFGPNDPDVVYIEYPTGTIYLEKQSEVERYTLMFNHLRAAALPTDSSGELIARVASELGK